MITFLLIAIFVLFSPVALFAVENTHTPEPIKIEVSDSIHFSDSAIIIISSNSNT